jgi:DNA-binding protein YbaB
MAKGGFPNMGGANINNLMKQVQKMQKQMQDMQEEIETKEFTATVGGGAVTAVVNGKTKYWI